MAFHRKKHLHKKRIFRKHVKKGKKMTFAKKVMGVVRKKEQHKVVAYAANTTFGNYNSLPTFAQFYASPQSSGGLTITQGTEAGQRIGNKVRVHKMILRGIITSNLPVATYNTPGNPQEVRLVIGVNKLSTESGLSTTNLFTLGDVDITPSSTLLDMMYPINKRAYRITKDKTFKVGPSAGNASTIGTPIATPYLTNNDFKLNQKFTWDLTKGCPKTLEWTSGVSGVPVLISPVMYGMIWSAAADGSSVSTQVSCCTLQYELECWFTDF